jgi:hypothetical protein
LDVEAESLLFSPEWTEEWFREQYERFEYLERPDVWRLKTEAQFLLVAVRGIYLMSKAFKRVATGSAQRSIQRAISEFEGAAPDAMLLRHIHEHFDKYGGGQGSEASSPPGA